jgi:hypothetical protein
MRISKRLLVVAVPLCTVALAGSTVLVRAISHGIDWAERRHGNPGFALPQNRGCCPVFHDFQAL